MKRVVIAVFSLLFIFACTAAYAHPPQDIEISFDPATKMLTARITHITSDAQSHYIKKADIAINGAEIIEHKISRQDNGETQTVTYLIPDAKSGDVISVEAYCSISGKLEKEITLE